jgi:hypothetical protein
MRDPRTPQQLLARRLLFLTAGIVVVDLLAAYAFLKLEEGAHGTQIHTYGDALFWTSSQLSSVSSSIANPLTTGGRVLAVFIDIVAIGVVTLLVATVVQHSHLITPGREEFFRRRKRREGSS